MSLRVILAVHDSSIEPRLRHLAQTLAVFADENGQEIRPGVRTLMKATGHRESLVRHGLQALVATGVLERDGQYGHTRRFRFNLEALARYRPRQDAGGRAESARRREAQRRQASQLSQPEPCTTVQVQPCTVVQGSEPATLHTGAINPALGCSEPCTTVPLTLHWGATDLKDLKDLNEKNGAGAPMSSHEDAMTEEVRAKYIALAKLAIADANRDRDDSLPTVKTHFKRRCAAEGLHPNSQIVSRAIAEALAARAKSQQQFIEQLRQFPGHKSR
jgi:hypothetical protein